MLSVEERATRYIDQMDPAIQGQRGSVAAFKAAIALVQGFNLNLESALRIFIDVYNPRCSPPWTEKEAHHKIFSADKARSSKPRGYLLSEQRAGCRHSKPRISRDNSIVQVREKQSFLRVDEERPPTTSEWRALADYRGLNGPGVLLAVRLGLLRVGRVFGTKVWGMGDADGPLVEVRPFDWPGVTFPAYGDRPACKSLCLVSGDDCHRPYGFIPGVETKSFALAEGLPDWLALWDQVPYEFGNIDVFDGNIHHIKSLIQCLPLCMRSSSNRIGDDYVNRFMNKSVRIFPHNDKAGIAAAIKWFRALSGVARNVDIFDCRKLKDELGLDFNDVYSLALEGTLPR